MKRNSILSLAAMLLLMVSCHPATEVKTSPDVRTFGMTGDVKEVYLSQELLSNSAGPYQGEDPWLVEDFLELSFNEQGLVTDANGLGYDYDAEGNYLPGDPERGNMVRDAQGRIEKIYDYTQDAEWEGGVEDPEACLDRLYTYDDQGRPVTERMGSLSWGTTYTYTYEGDKPYPASCTYKENTVTYEYKEFDDKGNWTERITTFTCPSDAHPTIQREVRKISYWSD